MFRRLGAGSGALWQPWYDGGRHGDRELARFVVFCVSIVRQLLPRGKTEKFSVFEAGSKMFAGGRWPAPPKIN